MFEDFCKKYLNYFFDQIIPMYGLASWLSVSGYPDLEIIMNP